MWSNYDPVTKLCFQTTQNLKSQNSNLLDVKNFLAADALVCNKINLNQPLLKNENHTASNCKCCVLKVLKYSLTLLVVFNVLVAVFFVFF